MPRLAPEEMVRMRNELFTKEKERQLSLHPRIEKIEVKYTGKSHPGTVFVMNKALSTPYNCAMHLSEWHCKKSVLALVDGEVWDMYRPLTKSCEIQFLTFKDEDPEEVNKAYWRSCAMIMACVLKRAFKDEYSVSLVKAPEVPAQVDISVVPGVGIILAILSCIVILYKMEMIERKASQNMEGIVMLHRFGDFVDVTEGPHIPRTSFCFQYEITAAHNLQTDQSELIRRFQGVSLPVHLRVTEEKYMEAAAEHLEAKDGTEEGKTVSLN
ncbi:39S ribosomal protein L39, mitochondrial [Pitangus sulphuratus]|nr:39S ribosomal protein L39, mitochondrial [Pitangus sulphuratus]